MNILAKDFNTRQELEKKVASRFGLTATAKPEHTIKGTKAELAKLQLGHGSVYWGIRVEQTGTIVKPPKPNKVNRGKVHKTRLGRKAKVNIKKHKDV